MLEELVEAARTRVEEAKVEVDLETMCHDATVKALNQKATYQCHRGGMSHIRGASTSRGPLFWLGQVLSEGGVSFVCEIKRSCLPDGAAAAAKPLTRIVAEFEQAGASALCYVTEPTLFGGSVEEFSEVLSIASLPVMRRDVIVDEYQLYEAKMMDAAAVTLSAAVLDGETVRGFIQTCDLLGLDVFVEVHDEEEVRTALDAGARIVSVDTRDPQSGEIDLGVVGRIASAVPLDCVLVAQSGIRTREDVECVVAAGVDAVMIGEALLRAQFMGATLGEFCYAARKRREDSPETDRGTRCDDEAGAPTVAPPSMPGSSGVGLPGGAPVSPAVPLCPPAPVPGGFPS